MPVTVQTVPQYRSCNSAFLSSPNPFLLTDVNGMAREQGWEGRRGSETTERTRTEPLHRLWSLLCYGEWPCIPGRQATGRALPSPYVGPTVTRSAMAVYKDLLTDAALDTVLTLKTDLDAVLTVGLMSVFPGIGRAKTHLSHTDSSVQR